MIRQTAGCGDDVDGLPYRRLFQLLALTTDCCADDPRSAAEKLLENGRDLVAQLACTNGVTLDNVLMVHEL